jgi:signal transduction histidine kinase
MHFEDIEVKLICKEALLSSSIKKPFIIIEIDKTTLRVLDNAGGIKAKNLQKIFEPYFTTKEKSSGIGLYMSKMIVEESMGGRLKLENRENGVLTTIILPIN